jgi:hypothetical protein
LQRSKKSQKKNKGKSAKEFAKFWLFLQDADCPVTERFFPQGSPPSPPWRLSPGAFFV